jgi:hypothetical protein
LREVGEKDSLGDRGGTNTLLGGAEVDRFERIRAAIALERPDRIPVMPIMSAFAVRHAGLKQAEAWGDPEEAFRAFMYTFHELENCDMLTRTNMTWPMIGGKFHNAPIRNKIPGKDLPEDALNQIDERELFTREDYDKIAAVGWNGFWEEHYPKLSGRTMDSLTTKQNHLLKVYVDQVKVCHEQNIPVLVGVAVDSVLMAFSLCRTMTNFTMDLFEVPDKVKAAMDASCDDFIRNALETLEITKIPYAWIVLERGSAAIYRLALFEEFEWPYLQRYVDAFVSSGVTPWMHLDTDWGGNLPYFRQLPRGKCVADLDSYTDIFKAKEILRDHMCISGDVPAATLTMGSQQEVYEYCKRLIDVVGKGGGFFLTTGCECPIDAKFENVKTMVDIVNEYRGKE